MPRPAAQRKAQAASGLSGESNRGSQKKRRPFGRRFFCTAFVRLRQRDCAAGASRLLTGRSRAPAVREAARRKPSEQRAQGRRSRRRSATIANCDVSLVRVQQGEPKETASFWTPFLFGSTRSGWTRRPVKKTMRCIVFRARGAYAAPGCAAQSASRQRLKRRVQQGEPKETASFWSALPK